MSAPPTALPERTFALLVGIEKYELGSDLPVFGAAEEACAVAAWLRRRHVPADNIFLFLSPTDGPAQPPPGVVPRPATAENIRRVLVSDLRTCEDGELLFLFWSGHGVTRVDHQRRLYFADSTAGDRRVLNLDKVLNAVRTDAFASFPLFLGIVDACADYAEFYEDAWSVNELDIPASSNPAIGRRQFELYSAMPRERAVNRPRDDPGSFFNLLMTQLTDAPGATWPPDMVAVAGVIRREFEARRAALKPGQREQHPIFRCTDWEGGGGPEEARAGGIHRPEDARRLAAALAALPSFADPARRDSLLRWLPFAAGLQPWDRPDLYERLAGATLDHRGGLELVAEAVAAFDPAALAGLCGELQRLCPRPIEWVEGAELKRLVTDLPLPPPSAFRFDLESPGTTTRTWEDCRGRPPLYFLIDWLAAWNHSDHSAPLLEFVEGLLPSAPPAAKGPLDAWLGRVAARLRLDRTAVAQRVAARQGRTIRRALLVRLERMAGQFRVRSWLAGGSRLPIDVTPAQNTAATRSELEKVLGNVCLAVNRHLSRLPDDLTVEFFLPNELLVSGSEGAIDQAMLKLGKVTERPVGAWFPVVVRSLERSHDEEMELTWSLWRERWGRCPVPPTPPAASHVAWVGDPEDYSELLYDKLSVAGPVCLAVSLAAPTLRGADARRTLERILDAGTPIALWLREPVADTQQARVELEKLVQGQSLERLPGEVRDRRRARWTARLKAAGNGQPGPAPHLDSCLVLLWDDPERLPPDAAALRAGFVPL